MHVLPDLLVGNGTFPSGFPVQEGQNAHCSQTGWTEEQPQESPSTWDTAACVGSKVRTAKGAIHTLAFKVSKNLNILKLL